MRTGKIDPKEIRGIWDCGYVLDVHTLKSEYLGDDDFGYPRFKNTRSELGELVYQLKYRGKYGNIVEIMKLITPFLDGWNELKSISSVIPVPPSNKYRDLQPVEEISKAIATYLGVYCVNVLDKINSNEAKNAEDTPNVEGYIKAMVHARIPCNILLVDDLYRTGATITECVNVLRQDANINKIYVLAMTRTKSRQL